MTRVQVVTIGNPYEQFPGPPRALSALGGLGVADERVLSQKALYWRTPYGWPAVSIVSAPTDKLVVGDLRQVLTGVGLPLALAPRRSTSSICRDLLHDTAVLSKLLEALDRHRTVHLSPYVWSEQVQDLADYLRSQGFRLVGNPDMSMIVRKLGSKTRASALVLDTTPCSGILRPRSWQVRSVDEMQSALVGVFSSGWRTVVIKSDNTAGGTGVFVLGQEAFDAAGGFRIELLSSKGYNPPVVEAPFLIEAHIAHELSPTADAYVDSAGRVKFEGIALQRLFDDRYYAGFHFHTDMHAAAWVGQIRSAQAVVGKRLTELGYEGFFNLDFVVDPSGSVYTIELNVRRSALQDGFSLMEAANRSGYRVDSVSTADYVEMRRMVESPSAPGSSNGSVVLRATDGGLGSQYKWASLCALGQASDSERALAGAVADAMGVASDSAALEPEIGTIPLQWRRARGAFGSHRVAVPS